MIEREQFEEWYREARDFCDDWKNEAMLAYEMKCGRQWSQEELDFLQNREQPRPALTFNRISPVIESIRGYQINNRQEVKYVAREVMDRGVTDLANAALKWADEMSQANHQTTDAFTDMAICGMGWTEMSMDFTSNQNGNLVTATRISPLEMLWDSAATQYNLADARYIIRHKWLSKEEVLSRWPDYKGGLESYNREPETLLEDDDDYAYGIQWRRHRGKEVMVVQCQYYELEDVHLAMNPNTRDIFEVYADEDIKALNEMGIKMMKTKKKRFYQLFVAGGEMLEHTPAPHPEQFTFHCMTGSRDENRNYWYGIVKMMIDPQKWSNKFLSDIQDYVASNRGGGAFVEEDAFVDQRKAEEDWNDPTGLIRVTSGALREGKIMPRTPSQYPQGLDRLLQFAINAIPDVTGVNLEMMGMVDRAQAGVLEYQRKQAGLTILAPYFNSLAMYLRSRGRCAFHFFRKFLADGRLIRIIGDDPGTDRFVPLFFEQHIEEFDVIVDTAPTAPNMREQVFIVLRDIIPYMAKLGFQAPEDIFEYLPLPAALTDKWKTSISKQKQAAMSNRQQDPKVQQSQIDMQIAQLQMQMEQMKFQYAQQQNQVDLQKLQLQSQVDMGRLSLEQQKLVQESQKQSQEQFEYLEMQKKQMDLVKAQANAQKAQADVVKKQAQAQKEAIESKVFEMQSEPLGQNDRVV